MRVWATAILACAILAIAGGGPALGAEPAKTSADATAKPGNENSSKEKLICKTQEVAGSLIPKRVCQTQKQIDLQREAVDDLVKERRELGATRTEALGLTPSGPQPGR